jgi:NAD(P)-dependent dehydrogenase (short-subunit alcohol dehydrogenase family)
MLVGEQAQGEEPAMPVALITGASRGLGRALAQGLADRGWSLVIDGRGEAALAAVAKGLGSRTAVVAVPGDVKDPDHRAALVAAASGLGGLDVLVNNAGILGPSPQPELADYPLDVLVDVFAANVVAPLGLIQAALPLLAGGRIINVTSDAGVEAYGGWGGYGSAKAALDHLSRVLAVERPELRVWSVDPGDLRTQMHQDAFPGEDISDRPLPESVVPALVALIDSDRPSGRYRVADLDPVR